MGNDIPNAEIDQTLSISKTEIDQTLYLSKTEIDKTQSLPFNSILRFV